MFPVTMHSFKSSALRNLDLLSAKNNNTVPYWAALEKAVLTK